MSLASFYTWSTKKSHLKNANHWAEHFLHLISGMRPGQNKTSYVRYLPVYGSFSTGLIYLSIGVIAILSFMKIKDGGADESSLLAFLYDHTAGKVLFWIILLGTICYVLWRIYETVTDPYGYGKSLTGLARRTGIAMSTIPDILIALTALQVLMGTGNIQIDGRPLEQRQLVEDVLQKGWGSAAVIAVGVIVCLTALVQFYYGITRGYKERLDIVHYSLTMRKATHALAWVGYLARGVILGIIGFFFIKAGVKNSASHVVNTDKAFDFIGDHVGHLYFILAAVGTICYGVFMFILGFAYDADKD